MQHDRLFTDLITEQSETIAAGTYSSASSAPAY
jgi:hypothetical protein